MSDSNVDLETYWVVRQQKTSGFNRPPVYQKELFKTESEARAYQESLNPKEGKIETYQTQYDPVSNRVVGDEYD